MVYAQEKIKMMYIVVLCAVCMIVMMGSQNAMAGRFNVVSFEDLKAEFQSVANKEKRLKIMYDIWKKTYIEEKHVAFLVDVVENDPTHARYYAFFALYGMENRVEEKYIDFSVFTDAVEDDSFDMLRHIEEVLISRRGHQRNLFQHLQDVLSEETYSEAQRIKVMTLLVRMSQIDKKRGYKRSISYVKAQLRGLLFRTSGELRVQIALALNNNRALFDVPQPLLTGVLTQAIAQDDIAPEARLNIAFSLSEGSEDSEEKQQYRKTLSTLLVDDSIDLVKRKKIADVLVSRSDAYVAINFLLGRIEKGLAVEQVEYAQSILSKMLINVHLQKDGVLFNKRKVILHPDYDKIFPVMEDLLTYPHRRIRNHALEFMGVLARPFRFQSEEVLKAYLKNVDPRTVERVQATLLFKRMLKQQELETAKKLANAPLPKRPELTAPAPMTLQEIMTNPSENASRFPSMPSVKE